MSQPTPPVGPPLQASSPTHLPTGVTVPRQIPAPVGSSGQFSVDLQRAPQAIRDLEDAQEQLLEIKKNAVSLGKISPPAQDPVSQDAALVLGTTATGGPGSLLVAIDAGIEQLGSLISKLRGDLQTYRGNEEETAAGKHSAFLLGVSSPELTT